MRHHHFNDPGHAHFLTFTCYRRIQLLTSERSCGLLAESLQTARGKHDFHLWAYVFMPDHVHLLILPNRDQYSISAILRDIKGPFARRLTVDLAERSPGRLKSLEVQIGRRRFFRVWQAGSGFDRNLYSPELIRKAIDYIEWNPVRAGIVADPTEWRWSSARARTGRTDVPLLIDPVA